jgi:hypothetical protein
MKYLITLLTAGLLLTTFSIDAEAQILNRLKKKAQQAAENKAEEKIAERVERAAEQMVERSWNSVFGEMPEDSTSGFALPFSMSSDVTTEEAYSFNTITTMELQTIDKNGESEPPLIMKMHFNDDAIYTGTKFEGEEMDNEEGDLFLIYDFHNSAMLMLMENEEDKFSFAYKWEQAYADSVETSEDVDWDEVDEWQNYKKIGTKSILGYDCDGYRSETEKENVEIWVSREVEYGMNNLFQANANAKQLQGKIPHDYPQGMLMEMKTEDLENGETVVMKTINITEDANVTYAMSDYPTMSLGLKAEQKQ